MNYVLNRIMCEMITKRYLKLLKHV